MISSFSASEVTSSAKGFTPSSIVRHAAAIASSALVSSALAVSLFTVTNPAYAAEEQTSGRVAIDKNGNPVPTPQFKQAHAEIAADSEIKPETATAATPTLSYPYGIGLDDSGNIYITNLFGGVNVYAEASRKKLGSITSGVSFPAAVAVAFNGNIYVANNGGNNITIYNQSYTQIGTITDSTLDSPVSMYIDASGDIWVLDAGGTTHLYLFDGTPISSVHSGGTCIGPWGPDVTVWGIDNGQGGYLEDIQNAGQAVRDGVSFPSFFPSGSPYAGGEAEDATGQQYVTDVLNNRVEIWAPNSSYMVGTISTPGAPYGIAVDSVHTRFYVVETTLNQVQVFSTHAPYVLIATIK